MRVRRPYGVVTGLRRPAISRVHALPPGASRRSPFEKRTGRRCRAAIHRRGRRPPPPAGLDVPMTNFKCRDRARTPAPNRQAYDGLSTSPSIMDIVRRARADARIRTIEGWHGLRSHCEIQGSSDSNGRRMRCPPVARRRPRKMASSRRSSTSHHSATVGTGIGARCRNGLDRAATWRTDR